MQGYLLPSLFPCLQASYTTERGDSVGPSSHSDLSISHIMQSQQGISCLLSNLVHQPQIILSQEHRTNKGLLAIAPCSWEGPHLLRTIANTSCNNVSKGNLIFCTNIFYYVDAKPWIQRCILKVILSPLQYLPFWTTSSWGSTGLFQDKEISGLSFVVLWFLLCHLPLFL